MQRPPRIWRLVQTLPAVLMPAVPRGLYLLLGDLATHAVFGNGRWEVVARIVAVHMWMSLAVRPTYALVDVMMRAVATHDSGDRQPGADAVLVTTVLAFAATGSVAVAGAGVAATLPFHRAVEEQVERPKMPYLVK